MRGERWISTPAAAVIAAALLAGSSHAAGAQAYMRYLEVPATPSFDCRVLRDTAAEYPPGTVGVEIELGSPSGANRLMKAWFEPNGRPLMLTEITAERLGPGHIASHGIHAIFAFDPDTIVGFHQVSSMKATTLEEARTAKAVLATPGRLPPLTAQETAKAKALARWMWDQRRCGRSAGR